MNRKVIFFGLALLFIGCGRPARPIPATPPAIAGMITRIEAQGQKTGLVLVEENPAEASGSKKARVKITADTRITRKDTHTDIRAADLYTNLTVQVWYAGPVLESYPEQATASVMMVDNYLGHSSVVSPPAPPKAPGPQEPTPGTAAPDTTRETGEASPEPPAPESGPNGDSPSETAPDLPVLTAVREASHKDFDRVVFEFDRKLPRYQVDDLKKAAVQCGSGKAVTVAGRARLEVRFDGAEAHSGDGRPSVPSRDHRPAFPVIEQILLTCDFEGHVTWVIGVSSPRKYTVKELSDPPRLVIDIQH